MTKHPKNKKPIKNDNKKKTDKQWGRTVVGSMSTVFW